MSVDLRAAAESAREAMRSLEVIVGRVYSSDNKTRDEFRDKFSAKVIALQERWRKLSALLGQGYASGETDDIETTYAGGLDDALRALHDSLVILRDEAAVLAQVILQWLTGVQRAIGEVKAWFIVAVVILVVMAVRE